MKRSTAVTLMLAVFIGTAAYMQTMSSDAIANDVKSASDGRFDANGNLTTEASRQFFKKISESLVESVGDAKYIAAPFPDMFMSSGYFRNENGVLMFINPTFGMLVFFETPSSKPQAIGVTELFSIIGSEPKGEKSNIAARYFYFNKYIGIFFDRYKNSKEEMVRKISLVNNHRETATNKVFLSDPIMRAANPDVRKCFADFPADKYAHLIKQDFQSETGDSSIQDFQPVDLVPLPDSEGALILMNTRFRSLNVLIPLKRVGEKCNFSDPKYIRQD